MSHGYSAEEFGRLTAAQQNAVMVAHTNMQPSDYENFKLMCDYLGFPGMVPNQQQCRPKSSLALWELWYGENPHLSDIIQQSLTANGSYILGLFPHEDFEGTHGTVVHMVFESQTLDETPDMLPNSIMEVSQTQEDFGLVTKGATFLLNTNFIFAPDGRAVFGAYCAQLQRCLEETMEEHTLRVIKIKGCDQMLESLPPMPMDDTNFMRTASEYASTFGVLQKQEDGITYLNGRAQTTLSEHGATADVAILPAGSIGYVKHFSVNYTQYSTGGTQIYDKNIITTNRQVVRSTHHGIDMFESISFKQPFNKGGPAKDPFYETRTIGTVAEAADETLECMEEKDYLSSYRSITLGSFKTTFHTWHLSELIKGSGLWDKQGRATEMCGPLLRRIIEYNVGERDWTKGSTHGGGGGGAFGYEGMGLSGLGGLSSLTTTKGGRKRTARTAGLTERAPSSSDDQDIPTLGDLYESAGLLARVSKHIAANREVVESLVKRDDASDVRDSPSTLLRGRATGGGAKAARPAAAGEDAAQGTRRGKAAAAAGMSGTEFVQRVRAEADAKESPDAGRAYEAAALKAYRTTPDVDGDEKLTQAWLDLSQEQRDKALLTIHEDEVLTWFRTAPITRTRLLKLVEANIRIPINFLIARKGIRFSTGQYCALKRGKETGVIYVTHVLVELVRNGQQRQVGLNLNFDFQTVIHTKKHLVYWPDIFVRKYEGGYESDVWMPEDNYDTMKMRHARDVHILPVPSTWRLKERYLDITGKINPDMRMSQELNQPLGYPTADIVSAFYQFGEVGCHLFLRQSFINQNPFSNTFLWKEPAQLHIPDARSKGANIQTNVLGFGHMGDIVNARTFRVFSGMDDRLQSAYDNKAVRVGVQ